MLLNANFRKGAIGASIIIFRIFKTLPFRRKKQLLLLFFLMQLSAIAELISIGSILPFLTIISNAGTNKSYGFLERYVIHYLPSSEHQLVILVTAIFCGSAILSGLIRSYTYYFSRTLASSIGSEISIKIFSNVLSQNYLFHVQSDSSYILTAINTQCSRTITAISSILQLFSSILLTLGVISGLVLISKNITLSILCVFTFSYSCFAILNRRRLARNSSIIARQTEAQVRFVQESLRSIRDIIISQNQELYISSFSRIDKQLRSVQAENSIYAIIPRYIIEVIGLVLLSIVGTYIVIVSESEYSPIAILGTFALGFQRLLPTIQSFYVSWVSLRAVVSDLNVIINLLSLGSHESIIEKSQQYLSLGDWQVFELVNVNFSYDNSDKYVLADVNLVVKRGECIGIKGATGSGKSTLVDIIMTLLFPVSGHLKFDNYSINHNDYQILTQWRRQISHVPQDVFIANTTVAENIAFGSPPDLIDLKRVKEAAAYALCLDFIEDLDHSFDTPLGEYGLTLSGGQRQRIGLARALYSRPSLLILDEATSALDDHTESLVIDSINRNFKSTTIIMIAHRISTLKYCDKILEVSDGKILS